MSDLNDKDPIEDLFKKKSGDYNISYREEDWNALEKRLDAVDAQIATRRRRWVAAAVVLIVFSLLSYFIFQNYQKINTLNEKLSQQEEVTVPAPEIPVDSGENAKSNLPRILEKEDNELAENIPKEPANTGSETQGKDEKISISSQGRNNQTTLASAGESANSMEVSSIPCPSCNNAAIHLELATSKTDLKAMANSTDRRQVNTDRPASISSVSKTMDKHAATSKASVGFIMGPDLSSAGSLSNFNNTGSKIGMTLDYNFNRNWGISIGAIRSNVHYSAGRNEYRPPQGYWYKGIQASETTAECMIIDIPVNLTYRFMHFDNSRVFATAGFSSYIMLNEDYRFSYETNQPELPKRWNEDTGTAHLLSNANFSVGYEYDITQNVSFRAEPFIKMPVREIGWGNVNLYSIGTLFSFNYNLQVNN